MKIKTKSLFIALYLCIAAGLSSANQYKARLGLGLNGGTGYKNYCADVSVDGNAFINPFENHINFNITGGLRFTENQFDITAAADINFFNFKFIDFAVSQILHTGTLLGVSTEIDSLIGGRILIHTAPWMDLKIASHFQTKIQKIDAFKDTCPVIADISPAYEITAYFNLPQENFIRLRISNWEDYWFPIFPSPNFYLGYGHTFRKLFTIEFDAFVRYSDFFTLTAYPDFLGCKLFMRYNFETGK